MTSETDILHAARWINDPLQREVFLAEVDPTIVRESKRWARAYRIGDYHEDIASEMRAEYLQEMVEGSTDGPFAKDSPTEAAKSLLGTPRIPERARTIARRIAKKQSRQAEIV